MDSRTSVAACLGKHPFSVETRGRSFLRRALLIVLGAVISYCALPAQAQADIRFVQQNYATPQSPQSTVAVSFTNAQTAGNFNIVVVGWNDTTAAVTSVTDSNGNTYALAVGPTRLSGSLSQSIFYASNVKAAGAGANTVTVQFSRAALYPDIRIIEFSGLFGVDPGPSPTAGASGNSAISSAGPVTTTNANDLILGANMVSSYTSGPGTGFTNIVITNPNGDIAEYEIVSSSGSYSATAPLGGAGLWVMQTVAFRGVPSNPGVIGKWTTTASTPINPIHAALLPTGKILIVAGSGNCPPSQQNCPKGPPYGPSNTSGAALYDPNPVAQTFTQFSLSWDMFCNSAVLLPNGQVLLAGGSIQYDPFHGSPNVAIFDPSTNTFQDVAYMKNDPQSPDSGRWYPTLSTLGNGQVMAFSGLNQTGGTNATVEIYDSTKNSWSAPVNAGWGPPLYPRMHLLPNGKVFYSGPGIFSRLFDPSSKTWSVVAKTNYTRSRTYGTSVLIPLTPANGYDPQVMIMGGDHPATNTTEIIDLNNPGAGWKNGPLMSQARIEMNAVILPTGKILALGGSSIDEQGKYASLNADLYDPASNTFSSAGANSYPRLYHSVALLLPDATVWLAGGNPYRGSYVPQMEIYQPAYLFTSTGTLITARQWISSAPTSISLSNQNPFPVTLTSSTQASKIASVVLVRMGAVTHAFNADQRLVGLSFTTSGTGGLRVTPPPNSSYVAPPGYYMLFLINTSGVPSLAWIVQVTS